MNNFEEENYCNITNFNFINEQKLTKLNLDINYIEQETLKSFNDNLQINTSLNSLKLYCSDEDYYDYYIFYKVLEYLCNFLKNNKSLNILDLSNINITDNKNNDIIPLLCDALKVNTSLTILNLNKTGLQNNGFMYLCDALQNNKSLIELYLRNNRRTQNDYAEDEGYYDEEYEDPYIEIGLCYGIRSLSNILKKNSSITKLDLGGNYIYKNDIKFLWKSLLTNTTLTFLDLYNNKIGKELDEDNLIKNITLGDVLKTNSSLTELYLGSNKLNNNDIKDIFEGLKVNTSLISLDLYNNEFDDEGVNYIIDTLKINTTLTFLNLEENKISDTAKQSLLDTLKCNTTLTKLRID